MSSAQAAGHDNGDGAPPPALAGSQEELRELLRVFSAVREGDFSVRLPADWTGLVGKIADSVNDVVAANEKMAEQLERVGQVVGKEGKTRQRVRFPRQTPLTSGTSAWPPNLPSVPTSRATRVTSEVNTPSCLIIELTMVAERRNSP